MNDAVGGAETDLAAIGVFAGQGDDLEHHPAGVLAARCPEYGGVDALEANIDITNRDGVCEPPSPNSHGYGCAINRNLR